MLNLVRVFSLYAAFVLLPATSIAADYQAVTTAAVILRGAPQEDSEAVGAVPTGTPVSVEVCFSEGAFCLISWGGQPSKGFVSGDFLSIANSTQSVHDAEATKWANWKKPVKSVTPGSEVASSDIVVWGDSLSADTFGRELGNLLSRDVEMQGVGGENGRKIGDRQAADVKYKSRIAIIWDRHDTGEDAATYMADLAPLFERLRGTRYLVISDIRSLSDTIDVEQDAITTEAVNARLKADHPDNFIDVTDLVEDSKTRTDGLHLTPATYDAVAHRIAESITAKGL